MLRAFKPLFLVLSGEIFPTIGLFPFPCLWPGQSSPDSCGLLSTQLLPFLLPSPSFCWRSGLEDGGAVCLEMFWGLAAGGGAGFITTLALCSLGGGKKRVIGQGICSLLLGTGAYRGPALWGWTLLIWPNI